LHRIEALPEHGCYSVTFLLDGNNERSVVMKVTNDSRDAKGSAEVVVPEANMLPGWSAADESFRAVLTAVRAGLRSVFASYLVHLGYNGFLFAGILIDPEALRHLQR